MAQSRGMKTYLIVLFILLAVASTFMVILMMSKDQLPLTHRYIKDDGMGSPFEGVDLTKLVEDKNSSLSEDESDMVQEAIAEVADKPVPSETVAVQETAQSDTSDQMSEEEIEMTMDIIANEDLTPLERYIIAEHEVQSGECFSLITADYWGDMYLWPDLYLKNDMRTNDPDLIYPGENIDIYNRLGNGSNYTSQELKEILDSYISVYKIYKILGEHKNNSAWGVLWAACKYDKDFLENYSNQIDPIDKQMAQKFINEAGFLQ